MGCCYSKLFVVKPGHNFSQMGSNEFHRKYSEYLNKVDDKKKNEILALLLMQNKYIPIEMISDYNKYILGINVRI